MTNLKAAWNALGKLIGLALGAAAIIGGGYAAIIGLTLITGF